MPWKISHYNRPGISNHEARLSDIYSWTFFYDYLNFSSQCSLEQNGIVEKLNHFHVQIFLFFLRQCLALQTRLALNSEWSNSSQVVGSKACATRPSSHVRFYYIFWKLHYYFKKRISCFMKYFPFRKTSGRIKGVSPTCKCSVSTVHTSQDFSVSETLSVCQQ